MKSLSAVSTKKILLCSVFGPYGRDDEFGSREMNPMELYHNQVTRTQGPFSLRMFHRSWGLMMIQVNIEAPCLVLDFPTLDRFIEEISTHQYEVIGISSIVPNILKVKKMCQLIRQFQPKAKIVIGGHISNMPDLGERIDADFIVKGEGIRWFREYLGEDSTRPIRHPMIISGFGARNAGMKLKDGIGDIAATIIPSVGCPMGCNFCSTSAMFGGKGKSVNFYQTGEELFSVMNQIAQGLHVCSFFIMDENFLLDRKRALRLLELMEKHNKSWALYVFTSANVLKTYTTDQLVRLGVSWVWMGLEGQDSQYKKLAGINAFELVKDLQANGIRVLGSTIIGLENHTAENINGIIEYAVRYDTDFHQFMLYTPIPGTPLYAELTAAGRMKSESEYEFCDIHGQSILSYRHPSLKDEQTTELMIRAFDRDFKINGPSTIRIVRTTLDGWLRYKNHSNLRVRNRIAWESRELATRFSALVGAAELYYCDSPIMRDKMSALLKKLHAEFGLKSWFYSFVGGRWLLRKIRAEEKRLASPEGFSYEPKTFYERNDAATDRLEVPLCRSALPSKSW